LRGKPIYEAARYMNCSTAAEQIISILNEKPNNLINSQTLCVGLARLGCTTQSIFAGTLVDMRDKSDQKLGSPLHSMVIVGRCHPLELTFLSHVANIDLDVLKCLYDKHEECVKKIMVE